MKIVNQKDVNGEIDIMKDLKHDNILKLIHSFATEDKCVIILELCVFSLADELEVFKMGLMAWKLHRFLLDFTSGFAYLYDNGIAHFDIKPQNILFGLNHRYKICDFGMSERLLPGQSAAGAGGTFEYAHPDVFEILAWEEIHPGKEMVQWRITSIVDLWSIGVTFYEAITGQLPFTASSKADMLYMIQNKPTASISGYESDEAYIFQTKLSRKCSANKQYPNFVKAAKPLLTALLQVSIIQYIVKFVAFCSIHYLKVQNAAESD